MSHAILEQIAWEIAQDLAFWGRISVTQYKEKYGTVRVYCSLGYMDLHTLMHPLRLYKHPAWPIWLWNINCLHSHKIFDLFHNVIYSYHKLVYTFVYKRAIKRWPKYECEILWGADYSELLENI